MSWEDHGPIYVDSAQCTFEHFDKDFGEKYAGPRTGYWRSEQWWERGTWRTDDQYGTMLTDGWCNVWQKGLLCDYPNGNLRRMSTDWLNEEDSCRGW
jgi:hypothetical protein